MTIITTLEELKKAMSDVLPDAMKKAQKQNPERLYTFTQAADLLGKTRQTIRRMVNQNRINTTTDGKYISQQAIDNYLNSSK